MLMASFSLIYYVIAFFGIKKKKEDYYQKFKVEQAEKSELIKKRINQNQINFLLIHDKIQLSDDIESKYEHELFINDGTYMKEIQELVCFYMSG
jgi:hypothetical protein